MKKTVTPLTFILCLVLGFFTNNFVIEKLSITNFTDQILCTLLVAIIFSLIAASFKVKIPE